MYLKNVTLSKSLWVLLRTMNLGRLGFASSLWKFGENPVQMWSILSSFPSTLHPSLSPQPTSHRTVIHPLVLSAPVVSQLLYRCLFLRLVWDPFGAGDCLCSSWKILSTWHNAWHGRRSIIACWIECDKSAHLSILPEEKDKCLLSLHTYIILCKQLWKA